MISSVYEIAAVVVAIAVSALAISAIPAILQIRRTFKAIEDLSLETKKSVATLNGLLVRVDSGVAAVEETISRLKQTGEHVTEVIDSFIENIKRPMAAIGSILFAIECALKLFFGKERKEGGVKNDD